MSTNIKTCICLFEVDVQENCSKQRGGKRGMKTACSWTIDNVSVTCLLCLWTVFWSNDQHLDPAWMCPISFYMFIIYNIYMVDPQDDLEVVHLQVETNIFHFSAAISACEKANHWQLALEMVQQMRQAWKTSPTHMVFPGTASRAAFLPFNLCMFISLMIVFNLTSRSLYVFFGVRGQQTTVIWFVFSCWRFHGINGGLITWDAVPKKAVPQRYHSKTLGSNETTDVLFLYLMPLLPLYISEPVGFDRFASWTTFLAPCPSLWLPWPWRNPMVHECIFV